MEYLSHRGYDPAFGARPVKRVVQRELESELARVISSPRLPRLLEPASVGVVSVPVL